MSCGGGLHQRSRLCDNPEPVYGIPCDGPDHEETSCQTLPCIGMTNHCFISDCDYMGVCDKCVRVFSIVCVTLYVHITTIIIRPSCYGTSPLVLRAADVWQLILTNEQRIDIKPQSHQACDQVTTYMRPKNGPIVERTYDWWQRSYGWWQRSWGIARDKSVTTRSMVMFKS